MTGFIQSLDIFFIHFLFMPARCGFNPNVCEQVWLCSMLTSFSLKWTNFRTHQLTTRVYSHTGMYGPITELFPWFVEQYWVSYMVPVLDNVHRHSIIFICPSCMHLLTLRMSYVDRKSRYSFCQIFACSLYLQRFL